MGGDVTHDEATGLLGAYALDALDPVEYEAVDRHAEGCQACRAEIAAHREVAGLLTPGWGRPPAGLWEKIAGAIEETPPPLDLAPVRAMKASQKAEAAGPGRRSLVGIAAMVAVAAVAVMGFLGVRMVDDRRSGAGDVARGGAHVEQLQRSADAALADPRARTVEMASTDGTRSARAVVLPDGTGYLVDADLPALPAERTYQLWAVVGTARISVGVLGTDPGTVPFKMAGVAGALAITEEKAGGVERTTRDPVVVGRIQEA